MIIPLKMPQIHLESKEVLQIQSRSQTYQPTLEIPVRTTAAT